MWLARKAFITVVAGVGPERHDRSCPSAGAEIDEPLEQLGRLDPLDDDRDRVAAVGDPASRPLPSTEVRQGDDRRRCRASRPPTMWSSYPSSTEPGGDRTLDRFGQAEALQPVLGVRIEGLLHPAAEPEPAERRDRRAGGDVRSSPGAAGWPCWPRTPTGWPCRRRRCRASPARTVRRSGTSTWSGSRRTAHRRCTATTLTGDGGGRGCGAARCGPRDGSAGAIVASRCGPR